MIDLLLETDAYADYCWYQWYVIGAYRGNLT